MTEAILEQWKPFDVNEQFISPGHIHEVTRFGSDLVRDAHGQPTGQLNWRAVYIDSVQIIAGQAFLGIKDCNFIPTDDKTGIKEILYIAETAQYENLFVFNRIQRYGTNTKANDEHREYVKQHTQIQEELKEQSGEETQ